MKTLYGYLILFISFSGLIYLKHSGSNLVPVSQRYFNSNTNIDSKIRKRIAKLEDSSGFSYCTKSRTSSK